MLRSLKRHLGCWLHERWKLELVVRAPRIAKLAGVAWYDLCNRNERLLAGRGVSRSCQWEHSSALTATDLFPARAPALLHHVLQRWPIRLSDRLPPEESTPQVSVLMPFRGLSRIQQFKASLASLCGQRDITFEIIVAEHSPESVLPPHLPPGTNYLWIPSAPDEGFNKSLALNRAAERARGEFLVIQDADFLVPERYLRACVDQMPLSDGLRPMRLLFCTSESSRDWLDRVVCGVVGQDVPLPMIEAVRQNTPNPMVVRRTAYWSVGGHDESFVCWGGEDLEFLDRMRTLRFDDAGFIPLIHLWHPPAAKKASGHRNQALQDVKLAQPTAERIARLRERHQHVDAAAATVRAEKRP